ncbi:hypothetical protein PTSG_08842 [Salpingoeca rosetta]|uniref:Uncharacterized protein n=1 Tax=Salpingoeca rosetta (strain ATCC 50818 / BSB-021) TaxID=946362 RepID=F2UKV4_SALR5|nr:uncharacterized protein PTSG_08842 [Salpingoeca rosetta]EGD77753.1 hypothetical protein PTSG_08842 [Salpingoeca rosetta]|eukprot:XP_004990229.1 hypothetical protein PTSG_08842 [Salpingoeca rosetta]
MMTGSCGAVVGAVGRRLLQQARASQWCSAAVLSRSLSSSRLCCDKNRLAARASGFEDTVWVEFTPLAQKHGAVNLSQQGGVTTIDEVLKARRKLQRTLTKILDERTPYSHKRTVRAFQLSAGGPGSFHWLTVMPSCPELTLNDAQFRTSLSARIRVPAAGYHPRASCRACHKPTESAFHQESCQSIRKRRHDRLNGDIAAFLCSSGLSAKRSHEATMTCRYGKDGGAGAESRRTPSFPPNATPTPGPRPPEQQQQQQQQQQPRRNGRSDRGSRRARQPAKAGRSATATVDGEGPSDRRAVSQPAAAASATTHYIVR